MQQATIEVLRRCVGTERKRHYHRTDNESHNHSTPLKTLGEKEDPPICLHYGCPIRRVRNTPERFILAIAWTNPVVLSRIRRRFLLRRRPLLPLRPHPLLRPSPARHGQHPLPHRHHPPPRASADIFVFCEAKQVEGECGVLGWVSYHHHRRSGRDVRLTWW